MVLPLLPNSILLPVSMYRNCVAGHGVSWAVDRDFIVWVFSLIRWQYARQSSICFTWPEKSERSRLLNVWAQFSTSPTRGGGGAKKRAVWSIRVRFRYRLCRYCSLGKLLCGWCALKLKPLITEMWEELGLAHIFAAARPLDRQGYLQSNRPVQALTYRRSNPGTIHHLGREGVST